jgi:DNA-binding CsgD family transcriptional regulator
MTGALLGALCAAFDQLEAGFVAVLASGEILFANSSARDMMDRGWPIRMQDGFLQGDGRRTTEALSKALRRVSEPRGAPFRGGCLDLCLASEQGAAIAALKPLPLKADGGCFVAVFVTGIESLDGRAVSPGVAECFGLTPMETKILQHLLAGGGVAEAASAFNIAQNTVKSHLRSIFAKMKLARQPSLIKLVNDVRPPLRPLALAGAAHAARLGGNALSGAAPVLRTWLHATVS